MIFVADLILSLNSCVLARSSSFDKLLKAASKAFVFSIIGCNILRSFCCLSPTKSLITESNTFILKLFYIFDSFWVKKGLKVNKKKASKETFLLNYL